MIILLPLIAGVVIMFASLAGVIFTNKKLGTWLNKNLNILVSLAAGTFAFLVYSLATESVELLGSQTALLFIFGSFLISWVSFKLIPFFHHHHTEESDHEPSPAEGRKILFADAIHNVGDGIILFASFTISPALGLVTTIGIFVHEFIQELSEYFVLRKAGYTNAQALLKNFQVSATIIFGILIAAFLNQLLIEPYLLAITAGVFLTIVLQDLLPETIESAREPGKLLPYTGAFVFGLAIMFGISNVAGHSHVHGDEDHEDHEEFWS